MSDIHLSHLRNPEMAQQFGAHLRETQDFDSVIVTGGIADARTLEHLLRLFASGVGADKTIFFVLGNHDYYGSSIAAVHEHLEKPLAANLVWLDAQPPILLDERTALVGKFAFYDARYGSPDTSEVILSDFVEITEFRKLFPNEHAWMLREGARDPLLQQLRFLARQAAREAEAALTAALKLRERVIFATHVPPFAESSRYGAASDERWLPWFTCEQMGRMLERVAIRHGNHKILVLCGHTHNRSTFQRSPNMRVITANAVYGAPDIAGILIDPFTWV